MGGPNGVTVRAPLLLLVLVLVIVVVVLVLVLVLVRPNGGSSGCRRVMAAAMSRLFMVHELSLFLCPCYLLAAMGCVRTCLMAVESNVM